MSLLMTAASAAVPKAASIDEIASALPEKPSADGAPASDRAKWGPIAASDEGKWNIARAEKIVGEPIPETPESLYLEFSKNGNRSNYERRHGRRRNGRKQTTAKTR